MGVAVEREIGAGAVDRLGQQVAPQEGIDLEPLALERVGRRAVMQLRHPGVAVLAVEARQRLAQAVGDGVGVLHEGLHLRLAEGARVGARETSAEALDTGDSEPTAGQVEHDGVAFQDVNPSVARMSATASGRPS